jgi:hypothetical protein
VWHLRASVSSPRRRTYRAAARTQGQGCSLSQRISHDCLHCAAAFAHTTCLPQRFSHLLQHLLQGGNGLPLEMSLIVCNFIQNVCFIYLIISPHSSRLLTHLKGSKHLKRHLPAIAILSQRHLIMALPCRAPFAEPFALNVAGPYASLPASAPVSWIRHRSCPPRTSLLQHPLHPPCPPALPPSAAARTSLPPLTSW